MRKEATSVNEAARNPIGCLEITRVIREAEPIALTDDGYDRSFGALLDARLVELAEQGACIQDIAFHFEPEQWHKVRHFYLGGKAE